MKIKKFLIIFLFSFILIGTLYNVDALNYTKDASSRYLNVAQFINIIQNNKEYDLSQEELHDYEEKIIEALSNNQDSMLQKQGYCSLGYIEFIRGNYKKSNENFFNALKYKSLKNSNVTLMIYSGISKNYIALKNLDKSKYYFNEAEALALKLNKKDELANMYRARAVSLKNFNNGIGEAIVLIEKAIKFNQRDTTKIENYIELSKLYMLSDSFESATKYIVDALNLSKKSNLHELEDKCIITMGNNFYIQKQYKKALEVYKNFLETDNNVSTENKLLAIGYIIYCYYELEQYEACDKYVNEYIKLTNKLSITKQEKDLNWLYILVSEIELKKGNIVNAKLYIDMAEDLYNKNEAYMYPNINIWMEQVKLDIKTKTNYNYQKILSEYKILLAEVEGIGIKSDLNDSITNSILNLSKENNDKDTALYYTEKKLKDLENKLSINFNTTADYALNKFENNKIQDKIYTLNKRIYIYMTIIISIIIILYITKKNSKKIKELNYKLEQLNITDPLTNLYNKRYLYEKINEIYNKNADITFIMMDVDCFKLYNDNYGHLEGDNVLKNIGLVLNDVFKEDIPCRYGGEEFVIISNGTKQNIIDKLEEFKEKVYELNIKHEYSTASDRISVSIGAETARINNKEDADYLLKIADDKLYTSKQNGRNRYTF